MAAETSLHVANLLREHLESASPDLLVAPLVPPRRYIGEPSRQATCKDRPTCRRQVEYSRTVTVQETGRALSAANEHAAERISGVFRHHAR